MPLLASMAVMLCTAMIIIIWSVMTGWLGLVTDAGRTFLGDVSIYPPQTQGMPHYETLCDELAALPEIEAAAPQLETFGLLSFPTGQLQPVQVVGIDPVRYHAVTGYADALFWVPPDPPMDAQMRSLVRSAEQLLEDAQSSAYAVFGREGTDAQRTADLWRSQVVEREREAAEKFTQAARRADELGMTHDKFDVVEMFRDRADAAERAGRLAERIDLRDPPDWAMFEKLDDAIEEALRIDYRVGLTEATRRAGESLSLRIGDERVPAMVMGIEVSRYNKLQRDGSYIPRLPILGETVTLGILPVDKQGGTMTPDRRQIRVANEFRSQVYEADTRRVFVPLAWLQKLMHFHEANRSAADDTHPEAVWTDGVPRVFDLPEIVATDPARITTILVKAAPGTQADVLRDLVAAHYARFAQTHDEMPNPAFVHVMTWRQQVGPLISAIQTQRTLMLTMFIFISFTAVFLVFAIFWSIVSEKVKDIGILRAIGASRAGVAWIFLRYGLTIGVIGSIAGAILATIFVRNINELHEFVGQATGMYIWTAEVYQFARIPGEVDVVEACAVMAGGILFSIFGALLPAVKAASLDPVQALRFE